MEGNYNGDYWADRAFPRAIADVRRGRAADRRAFRAKGWNEHAVSGLPQQQDDFKSRAGRAGRPPGCSTSRPTSRTSGPCATSAGPSTKGVQARPRATRREDGLPGRHLPAAVAARCPGRPARLQRGRRGRCGTYPRLVFDASGPAVRRARVRRHEPVAASNLQPVGWCLDAWAWGRRRGALADHRHGRIVAAGRRAGAVLPARRTAAAAGPGPLDPPQGLSPGPAGRRVPDALARSRGEPRWAVGRPGPRPPAPGRVRPGPARGRGRRPDPTTPRSARNELWSLGAGSARPSPPPARRQGPGGRLPNPGPRPEPESGEWRVGNASRARGFPASAGAFRAGPRPLLPGSRHSPLATDRSPLATPSHSPAARERRVSFSGKLIIFFTTSIRFVVSWSCRAGSPRPGGTVRSTPITINLFFILIVGQV